MACAVLLGGRFADNQELRFSTAERRYWLCGTARGLIADCQEWRFKLWKGQIWAVLSYKGVYFLMLRNRVFRLRNVLIWAVPSCKKVDLLMLRNRFFMRNLEIWEILSSNEVDLLMLRNRVFRLWNVQKCSVPSRKRVDLLMFRNCFSKSKTFRYALCRTEMGYICWFSGMAAKRSDMCRAILQEVRFADAQ